VKCAERAGFLIPRPCREEATVVCSACQKEVCGNHTAALTHGGIACLSCAGAQNVGPGAKAHTFRDYYGYHPGSWTGRSYGGSPIGYTHQDYAAFDSAAGGTDLPESALGS
jgi:hypothetical protein